MKTRLTELLGINYPILLSGMSWISVPKMVAAVSNAGGLGILVLCYSNIFTIIQFSVMMGSCGTQRKNCR